MDDKEWLTVEEARAVLRLSERQFYRYRDQLRTSTAGRRTLYAAADVAALADKLESINRIAPKVKHKPVEVIQHQAEALLEYLHSRDAELKHYQERVEGLLIELTQVRAELNQRRALEDKEQELRRVLAETQAERDELRQQIVAAQAPLTFWQRMRRLFSG